MLKQLQISGRLKLEGYSEDGVPTFDATLYVDADDGLLDFDIDRDKAIEIITFLKEFYGIE